jgi:capsular polysaccharide biosynthesis protein
VEPEVHWFFRQRSFDTVPERFVAELPWARICGEGVVITPTNQVLRDISEEFYGESGNHALCLAPQLPLPTFVDRRVAVVSSVASAGYYHWLFDCLPRLGLLQHDDVDLYYVNIRGARGGFQEQYLNLFGIPTDKLYFAGAGTHLLCRCVVAPSLPGMFRRASSYAREFLRRLLPISSRGTGPERVYVSRRDARRRRVVNEEDELWPWLRRKGFERVELAGLSVPDQIALFTNAKIIVGAHGAGLSHMVFSPPGARVVELFSPNCVRLYYWRLANTCQHAYGYLLGAGDRPPAHVDPDRGDEDMEIAPSELASLFSVMGIEG